MGRFVKNTIFKSGSHAIGIPVGTSTIRPDHPVTGQTQYNVTSGKMEYYANASWNAMAIEGEATVVKDTFAGNNITSVFGPMSRSYVAGKEAQVMVFLNTVYQNPGVNYTFNGTTNITFNSTPGNAAVIILLHNLSSTIAS